MLSALLLWVGLAAAEDAPRFLLQDAGVRVDLPDGWMATRWTPEALEADGPHGKLIVGFAPGQAQIVSTDLPAWTKVFERTAETYKGRDLTVRSTDVLAVAGQDVARVDLSFKESGKKGVLAGAVVPASGRVIYLSLIGLADQAAWLDSTLDGIVARLEVKEPAAALAPAELSTPGITTRLPAGWHAPVGPEAAVVAEVAGMVGSPELPGCWSAVRARPGMKPDVALACSSVLPLGVVDELSFADVEAKVLRPRLFGEAKIAAAEMVRLSDRLAFVYKPDSGVMTLRMGIVPHGTGMARLWVVGAPGLADALDADLQAVLAASVFEGEHPVGPGERIAYYFSYQPTSPWVIGPVVLLLAGIGVIIRMIAGPRTSPVDDIA
jgi:hypothetical protein